ncbi:MAG: hypothetical protein QW210_01510 [Candidatus Woesearchaeota archaeon]
MKDVFLVLNLAKQKEKAEELEKLIKFMETQNYLSINEIANQLNLKYKVVFKYLNELEKVKILEKESTINGIAYKLKKNYKEILAFKVKERMKEIINQLK